MEMLVKELIDIINEQDFFLTPKEMFAVQKALKKFADYEATGLTPDEVAQIHRASQTMMFPTVADFVRYSIQNFDDLEKYRKAEAEGHLIVPPCKVGDTVYIIIDGKVCSGKVYHISYSHYYERVTATVYTESGAAASFDDFGQYAFLTREEAKAALVNKRKEEQNGTSE